MLLFNAFWIIVSSAKPLEECWLTISGLDDMGLDRSPYRPFWFQTCMGSLVSWFIPSWDGHPHVVLGLTRYITALQFVRGMHTVKPWSVRFRRFLRCMYSAYLRICELEFSWFRFLFFALFSVVSFYDTFVVQLKRDNRWGKHLPSSVH